MRVFEISELIDDEENIAITKHLHTSAEPLHSHKFLEIAYVYGGYGFQNINDKQVFVRRGDLMLFFRNDNHSFLPDDTLGIYNCLVSPKFLGEHFTTQINAADILALTSFSAFQLDNIDTVIHFDDYLEIENIFDKMLSEFENKNLNYIKILHNYLEILFTLILRRQHNSSVNLTTEIHKISPEILKYIEEHYDQKITLTELAKMSFYTPSYFSRIFKECFNRTLTDFVTGLRIDKAIQLLKETNRSVDAVAEMVGFCDKKTFYNAFKKITGTTPSSLRRNKD